MEVRQMPWCAAGRRPAAARFVRDSIEEMKKKLATVAAALKRGNQDATVAPPWQQ